MPYNSYPTFEDHQKTSKTFSEDFIVNAFNNRLETADGQPAFGIKSYLDQIPVDKADKVFIESADKLSNFRDELGRFVQNELTVTFPTDTEPNIKNYLIATKEKFIQKINGDNQIIREYFGAFKRGEQTTLPRDEFEFRGFNVDTNEGKVDLLQSSLGKIRANILIQRQGLGNFVQWSSRECVAAKIQDKSPQMTKRIYLNPKLQDGVSIFSDVVHATEAAGISAQGKVFDRTWESFGFGEIKSVRGDGIVLYVDDKQANQLLRVVLDVYAKRSASFVGRTVSRVPKKLCEGLAIGDEPRNKQSLTSHRAEALEMTFQELRSKLNFGFEGADTSKKQQSVIQAFHPIWEQAAKASGIDPNNLAFNL